MTGTWIGFSSLLRLLLIAGSGFLFLFPSHTWALPIEGNVVAGSASIQRPSPSSLRIDQMSDRALLHWQGFSIGQGESVQFVQPSATSLAVNRVLGGDPSIILGSLIANGRVFLLNPNGVLFGPASVVNVGGLLATTLNLKSYDLTTGRFELAQDPTKAFASVVNQGTLRVADHGFLVLAAPGVVNDGLIIAKFGQVGLHAGTQLAVDFRGDGLIQYAVEGKVLDEVTDPNGRRLTSALSNAGHIEADGGTMLLTAQASSAVVSSVINQSGVIRARRLENQGGEIMLRGGDEGAVMVAGTLDAMGEQQALGTGQWAVGGKGGSIDVRGQQVGLTETARLDVSGENGGGTITVGGGFQGKDGGLNAEETIVVPGATLNANADIAGDGGTLIVWADGRTQFGGAISARAGTNAGNGGFAEVSGKEALLFAGTVDLRAPMGQTGTLLLDPKFINIGPGGATYSPPYTFGTNSSGTVTLLDSGANSLSAAINAADVTLQANTDITFLANANVTGTTLGNGLTLQAGRSIIMGTNSQVVLNGGIFNAIINDHEAIVAQRDAGMAQFTMNNGAQIVTNGGNFFIEVGLFGGDRLGEVRIGNGLGSATINSAGGFMQIGPIAGPGLIMETGSVLQTTTGDMKIITDAIALNGGPDSVRGNRLLQLEPFQMTTSIGLGDGAAGTFNLTSAEVLALKDGFGFGITIGKSSGQHAIDIQAVTFRDDVFIRTPSGGAITVNGTLASTGFILLRGSGNTVHLFADIVTDGMPITIEDNVVLEGGAGVTRRLITTGIVPNTFPLGANIKVTGTVKGAPGSGEAIETNAGTGGNLTLEDDVGCNPHPCSGFIGGVTGQGQTAEFGGNVYVGPNGQIIMHYPNGMNLFEDMKSPNAALIADGPVTIWDHLTLDVGVGSLEFKNTIKTVVVDPNTQAVLINPDTNLPRISNLNLYGNVIEFIGGADSIRGAGLNGTEVNGTIHTNVLALAQGLGASNTSLELGLEGGTLSTDTLAALGTGNNAFSTVQFGRADTTALITVGNFTATSPLTLAAAAVGGAIQVLGALSSQGHSVTLEASKNIQVINNGSTLFGAITTNNGPLTLKANEAGTATGNFVGIDLNGATLTAGSGPLTLLGKGGTTGNDNMGIRLTNNTQVGGGSGLLTMTGVGGNGGTGQQNVGVSLQGGSQVTTTTGGIQVAGTGGTNALGPGNVPTGQFNRGVQLITGAQVLSTGSGPITMLGQGGASGTIDHGLAINSRIASAGGAIDLTGLAGGTPTGMNNHGLILANGAQVEGTGPASIHLKGTGGQGIASDSVHGEAGVYIIGTNGTFVRTQAGALTVEGTGGGTSFGGYGVIVRFGAVVESTGGGAVLLKGTGSPTGTAFNHGVIVYEAGTAIRATGTVALTLAPGQGGGTQYNNYGVMVGNGALVEHLGTGQITITGTGGGNGDNEPANYGVLLLGAATQIKALQGEVVITGNGAGTPPATGVFQVDSPVIQDKNTPTIISNP